MKSSKTFLWTKMQRTSCGSWRGAQRVHITSATMLQSTSHAQSNNGSRVSKLKLKVTLQNNWPEFLQNLQVWKVKDGSRRSSRLEEMDYIWQRSEMCDPKLDPEQEKKCYKLYYRDNWWNMNVAYGLDSGTGISWLWSFHYGFVREYPSS